MSLEGEKGKPTVEGEGENIPLKPIFEALNEFSELVLEEVPPDVPFAQAVKLRNRIMKAVILNGSYDPVSGEIVLPG